MTITKQRLEEIALEVWPDIAIRGNQDSNQNLKDFALALIRRYEVEVFSGQANEFPEKQFVVAMPLISEE